jgi:hypothetical protein
MSNSFKKIESGKNIVWITQPNETEKILKRKSVALNIAKGKIEDTGGKIETAIQTAEAFGRGLYEEYIRKKSKEWTMDQWVKPVVENIFNPMGTAATFTEITEDEAKSFVFRYSLNEEDPTDPYLSSLFTYGFLRGILLSAFPDGELIMKSSMAEGAPVDEFTFKAKVADEDRFENERIKNSELINKERK